jgi:hypothetical protein
LGASLLCACQQPEANGPTQDRSLLGDATSNKTGLGGYWWSYVDRSGSSVVIPYNGKRNPNDTTTIPPALAEPLRFGYGLDPDASGNAAFHVRGSVAPSSSLRDDYWNAFYSSICDGGDCAIEEPYSAGLALQFKSNSRPLRYLANMSHGIRFRARIGATHATTGVGQPYPVTIRAATDYTEIPDPTMADNFGTAYVDGDVPSLYLGQISTQNYPLCAFPGSVLKDGTVAGAEQASCGCHMAVTLPALTQMWQDFCVLWSAWRNPGCSAPQGFPALPEALDATAAERLTRMYFDAYKPTSDEQAVSFDFWLDDVYLIDAPLDSNSDEASACTDAIVIR